MSKRPRTRAIWQNQLSPYKLRRAEFKRLYALTHYERKAREKGYQRIFGMDEVGRGPLAGPVVACCCYIEEGLYFEGIDDSKQVAPKIREELYEELTTHSGVRYALASVDHGVIDRINIYQATLVAMKEAILQLSTAPDYLLVDGLCVDLNGIACEKIIGGDALSQSIGAASIIAKVTRDRYMQRMDLEYPQYGFATHKGYATPDHLKALHEHGPSPLHRLSFSPCSVDKSFTKECNILYHNK